MASSAPNTPATGSSSGPRPASPSPSRSGFRTLARVGTMLRRNSSGFGFGRQSVSRSESKSSLKAAAAAQAAAEDNLPSPVPESPAREAAEVAAESSHHAHVGPSPLAHETTTSPEPSPTPIPAQLIAEPEPLAETAPVVTEPAPSPPVTIPEPSVTAPASQPASAPAPVPAPAPAPAPAPETTAPAELEAPVQPPSEPVVVSPKDEQVISRDKQIFNPEEFRHEEPYSPPVPIESRGSDYFAWGDPIVAKKASVSTMQTQRSVSVPVAEVSAPVAESSQPKVQEVPKDPYTSSAADSFAWKDEALVPVVKRSDSSIPKITSQEHLVGSPQNVSRPLSHEQLVASPHSIARSLSPRNSRSSIASSYGNIVNVSTGSRRVSVSLDPNTEQMRGRSRSRASIRVSFDDPYTDPFADPPNSNQMEVPKHTLSPIYSINTPMYEESVPIFQSTQDTTRQMPEPMHAEPAHYEEETVLHEATPAPVSMPLPALNEVTTRGVRQQPSGYSIGTSSGIVDHAPHAPYETNERLPLLPRMPTPNLNVGSSKAPAEPSFNDINVGVPPTDGVAWPMIERSFKSLGWTEHILPDSSVYYAHHNMRVVTDIDLRNARKLDAVTDYFDKKQPRETLLPPPSWELWLRDVSKTRYESSLVKCWVNHEGRILTFETPASFTIGESSTVTDDDKLDMEYRYWTYMEGHPAHAPLPDNAHAEAINTLTWCYTDYLLPSQQPTPAPFSPQECQELMGLLKAFDNNSNRIEVVHIRVVSRVLLRFAQWRQQNFRPNKPLPNDTSRSIQPERRRPYRRAFMDVIMSILCLGIPYLFMGRSSPHRVDEEGAVRSHGPIVVIGACACLIAAVILSASVTFLSLPGLDDISRLAGMIAILFSASSMVSAVVALFRYKADLERTVVYVGGEGLMVVSQRSIVMSLPVVFLAWGIAAFITGITFYSFRGASFTSKVVIRQPFTDYTHWAVVGGLGGLTGMLIVSILLTRR
ncbi:hypothetical protein PHLCEN_2v5723 [Hermanssonia centrifuga]|uniref:Uncharacterized protein n=1 Tax=Hermanssonia centrifuga TaxID=98765 RepID=A0A2R6P1I1_9APHY|nr:hypothetical protein PHLCEN_2v5723 [Hermanssonia centrifuga]